MPKIKVILTGGTIGSEYSGEDSVASLSVGKGFSPIENYYKTRPDSKVVFEKEQLINIHSENIGFSDWDRIYKRLRAAVKEDCDGIILTHGTDTLAYTASFLSLMLSGSGKPVMIVSSALPLENEHTNGYENFTAAADFIERVKLPGVFVPYAKNGVTQIHLASRLTQITAFTHDAESAGGVCLGIMSGAEFLKSPQNPGFDELRGIQAANVPEVDKFPKIICIMPVPGLDYDFIDIRRKPAAVLHGLYHSGTACTAPGNGSVLTFAKKCRDNGIDFYAAPMTEEGGVYPSAVNMVKAGVKILKGLTFEAAYAKLVIAYGAYGNNSKRNEFLYKNIAFEKYGG